MSDLDGSWLSPEELNGAMQRMGSDYRVPVGQALGGGQWQAGQPLVQGMPMQATPVGVQPVQAQPAASSGGSPFGQYAQQAMKMIGQNQQQPEQAPAQQAGGGQNPYAGEEMKQAETDQKRHQALGKIASIVGAFFTGGASMAGMTAAGNLGNK